MRISIPEGHKFSIQIYVKRSKVSGSKVFHSNSSLNDNFDKIKLLTRDKVEGKEIKLKLIDLKTRKTKDIHIKLKINNNTRHAIDKLKEELIGSIDDEEKLKDNKFRVVIDNLQTSHLDKRAFSMRFVGNSTECMESTRALVEEIIKEQTDEMIVFTHNKNRNHTHRVFIQKCGKAEDYKNLDCKSFSIKFPNYSSEEIIGLMRGKIQNGKK